MIAETAECHYDVPSGTYLDVDDDLAAPAALRTEESGPTRVLRVTDLPDEWHARHLVGLRPL
jgi:hypothetical protein